MNTGDIKKLFICLIIVSCVALTGSFFVSPAALDWHAGLQKPVFNPPSWLFGPVWTVLYLLMAVSAFLVWRKGLDTAAGKTAAAAFVLQLVFNGLWTPIFFGLRLPLVALGDIVILWLAVFATITSFWKVSKLAAVLLIPYIVWVSFAAVLNAFIYMLNR
ncbi:MAG: tryptophan-rich sensory protein [Endomicrobiales bacterium]|nr:tryptophan-rich sensory protein [Endomicrobiales bacterium]